MEIAVLDQLGYFSELQQALTRREISLPELRHNNAEHTYLREILRSTFNTFPFLYIIPCMCTWCKILPNKERIVPENFGSFYNRGGSKRFFICALYLKARPMWPLTRCWLLKRAKAKRSRAEWGAIEREEDTHSCPTLINESLFTITTTSFILYQYRLLGLDHQYPLLLLLLRA